MRLKEEFLAVNNDFITSRLWFWFVILAQQKPNTGKQTTSNWRPMFRWAQSCTIGDDEKEMNEDNNKKLGQILQFDRSRSEHFGEEIEREWQEKLHDVWVCCVSGVSRYMFGELGFATQTLTCKQIRTHSEQESERARGRGREKLRLTADSWHKDIALHEYYCLTQDQSSGMIVMWIEHEKNEIVVQDDYDDGKIERERESEKKPKPKREWRKRKTATWRHRGRYRDGASKQARARERKRVIRRTTLHE